MTGSALKGKTFDQIYGDRASEMRASRSAVRKGKSYIELFGPEKAGEIQAKISIANREQFNDSEFRTKHKNGIAVTNQKETTRLNRSGRTGALAGNWKGGRVVYGGYIRIYLPSHPRAQAGYVFEHHLVAEKVLGRYLKYFGSNHPKNEEVHHINFDGTDNRGSNLVICTKEYHRQLHSKIKIQRLISMFKIPREASNG